ncbi:MAG: tetraacyldisaccharide 4'-kinase [Woeseiaceae bacterium]|nr:tetraacyldisaccharide 4'-kinase [Woeseiaceae bacterium]
MAGSADSFLQRVWYGDSWLRFLLAPLGWIYSAIIALRRALYAARLLPVKKLPVPVIVVGNLTVGGTGKTPLVLWLARQLAERSLKPGIVSRGYGGRVGDTPLAVMADSDPADVGDEAVLMARHHTGPVVVHPDRVKAAELAIARGAEVIVSDDGLQHLRLARDVEIAVVDGERLFGNGWLLPAGPLREPLSRLMQIDQLVIQCDDGDLPDMTGLLRDARCFQLLASAICRLDDADIRNIAEFSGTTMHAIAGIGNPGRFFRMLSAHGIDVIPHPLADHARIQQQDLEFDDDHEIVMTEKDAVKCRWLDTGRCWYVPVDVWLQNADAEYLLNDILRKIDEQATRRSVHG